VAYLLAGRADRRACRASLACPSPAALPLLHILLDILVHPQHTEPHEQHKHTIVSGRQRSLDINPGQHRVNKGMRQHSLEMDIQYCSAQTDSTSETMAVVGEADHDCHSTRARLRGLC